MRLGEVILSKSAPGSRDMPLDAAQLATLIESHVPPSTAAFDEELARLKRTDAHTRSLALGALTRTLLEQ